MRQTQRYFLVRPDEALARRGLNVLIAGPEPHTPAQLAQARDQIEQFLAFAQQSQVELNRQVVAFKLTDGQQQVDPACNPIAGLAFWVSSPGRTAMLFGPNLQQHPAALAPSAAAMATVINDAAAAGIVLLQAMVEPGDTAGREMFASVGLSELATLVYMQRPAPMVPPAADAPGNVQLLAYGPETHGLFEQAIAASYEQTLDCPSLSGMRAIEDVIAGHKAVGPFDPGLWTVVVEEGRPLGCLLLSEVVSGGRRRSLELVYLGLAPTARGRGLGRMLMSRTLAIAARRGFDVCTLAVDRANAPALKLYRRFGFTSVAERVAYVKKR